jgi:hypothetical protein
MESEKVDEGGLTCLVIWFEMLAFLWNPERQRWTSVVDVTVG